MTAILLERRVDQENERLVAFAYRKALPVFRSFRTPQRVNYDASFVLFGPSEARVGRNAIGLALSRTFYLKQYRWRPNSYVFQVGGPLFVKGSSLRRFTDWIMRRIDLSVIPKICG